MRILLVEPYFTGSHQVWAEGFRDHSAHDVTVLTLPGRWWTWRMRGGAVTLADRAARLDPHDIVVVSDMIDLPLFMSRLRWSVPHVLYFHESQLTYPVSSQMRHDRQYPYINWASSLVADEVWFNSEYHRQTFLDSVGPFLRGFPDETHEHLVPQVASKSEVMPVGVDLSWIEKVPEDRGTATPLLLWNHRWEEDKDPGGFFAVCDTLAERGVEFRLAVCGDKTGRHQDDRYSDVRRRHRERLVQFGYAAPETYRSLLRSADVATSTALQEFFGVSVVEAMAAGAVPVLPNRLSYPSVIPPKFHDAVLTDDLVASLQESLYDIPTARARVDGLADAMLQYDWSQVAPRYDRGLEMLVADA